MTVSEQIAPDFGSTLALPIAGAAATTALGAMVTKTTDFLFDSLNPASYAGGALPATNAVVPDAGLTNVAPNTPRALTNAGLTRGAVTAVPYDLTKKPTFDGKGLVFTPTTKLGMVVKKVGVADNRVGEVSLEGFIDFLDLLCLKEGGTFAANSSPRFTGQSGASGNAQGGWIHGGAAGQYYQYNLLGTAAASLADSAIHVLALLTRFNVGAGTSTIRGYKDGAMISTSAGPAISAFQVNAAGARSMIGGQTLGLGTDSTLYTEYREYVGLRGATDGDVDAYVAKFSPILRARYA